MKQNHTRRENPKTGFTLVEVIVVLVVLAIIAAFAVPGITRYLDNMRATRQEETVRLLYSAAQNKLTYISANDPDGAYSDSENGFLSLFENDTISANGETVQGSGVGTKDEDVVLDIMQKNGGDYLQDGKQVACYSAVYEDNAPNTNGAKAVRILLEESGLFNVIEKADKCIIDIDPSLRFILRVTYQGVSLDFESIYNDSNVDVPENANPDTVMLLLDAPATNGEKLSVAVSCDSLSAFTDVLTLDSFKLGMTIVGQSSGTTFSTTLDGNTINDYFKASLTEDGAFSADITLDSLDKSFQTMFPDFIAGENIAVTFQLFYIGALPGGKTVTPSAEYTDVTNNLFARTDGELTGTGSATAYIASGRHLQNLQRACPNINTVVQSGDIDWKNSTQSVYGSDFALTPITNDTITGFSGLNGTQHTISGLLIEGDGDTGIFASSAADFSHVRLLDPCVSGTGDTGALVGKMLSSEDGKHGSITDCRAYITASHYNKEELDDYTVTSTGGNAGGLVGSASGGVRIENSFAALYSVNASGYAGGLAGSFAGAGITSSYADTKTITGQNVGGLAGSVGAGSSVSYSYAVTELLEGSAVSAGFAAANGGSIGSSYALVGSVLTSGGTAGSRYGFAKDTAAAETSGCYYYVTGDYMASDDVNHDKDQKISLIADLNTKLTGIDKWDRDVDAAGETALGANEGKYSHPYETKGEYDYLQGRDYPAPRIRGLDHYGNWPEPAVKYLIVFEKNLPANAILIPEEWKAMDDAKPIEYTPDTRFDLPEVPNHPETGEILRYKIGEDEAAFQCWVAKNGGTTVMVGPNVQTSLSPAQLEALATPDPDGNGMIVTFRAQWDIVRVIYDKNGASNGFPVPASQSKPSGTRMQVPDTPAVKPTKWYDGEKNRLFVGWATSAGGTADSHYDPGQFFTMPDTDLILYAVWEPAYTVVYQSGVAAANAGEMPPLPVDTNKYVKTDNATVRPNYIPRVVGTLDSKAATYTDVDGAVWLFKGWIGKDGGLYMPGNLISISQLADELTVKLNASWEKAVQVIYDGNGEDVQNTPKDPNYYLIEDVEATVISDTPARTGYEFKGWNTKADGSGKGYHAGDLIPLSEPSVTLYAQWEETPYPVTLYVTVNGEPISDASNSKYVGALNFQLYQSGKPTNTFAYDPEDGVYTASVKNGTYTLYMNGDKTTQEPFTISYAGRELKVDLFTLDVEITRNGNPWSGESAPTVTRLQNTDGRTLAWNSSAVLVESGTKWNVTVQDDIGDWVSGTLEMTEARTALFRYYTVTYNKNAADSVTVSALPSDTHVYRHGEGVDVLALKDGSEYVYPYREDKNENGHSWGFVGYLDDKGDPYNPPGFLTVEPAPTRIANIDRKITLYAQWEEKNYIVHYEKNANETSGTCPADEAYLSGESAIVSGQGSLRREDYIFIGWNTAADGSGMPFVEGDAFIVSGGEYNPATDTYYINLYAQWAYRGTYTIVFFPNGADAGATANATFFETASSVTLTPNGFRRSDYSFKGWSTSPQEVWDGSAPTWIYGNAATVTDIEQLKLLDTDGDYIIRFYAVWEYRHDYTVTFQLEHMNSGNSPTTAYYLEPYTAKLGYEGGYNPPENADEITVYVDNDRDGNFVETEKVSTEKLTYNAYTLELTIPGSCVLGNIKIVTGATAGQHTLTYYRNYAYLDENGDLVQQVSGTTEDGTYRAPHGFGSDKKQPASPYDYGFHALVMEVGASTSTLEGAAFAVPSGYVFTGWNTEKDGSGVMYQPGDAILIEKNTELYAQWKQTDIVGAFIYNFYRYNKHHRTDTNGSETYYLLLKGETQTMSDGETLEIVNNGGQPYPKGFHGKTNSNNAGTNKASLPYSFYYEVYLPHDAVVYNSRNTNNSYQVMIRVKGSANFEDYTSNLNEGFTTIETNYKLDERYHTNIKSDDRFKYYYFSRQNTSNKSYTTATADANGCVPEIETIRIIHWVGGYAAEQCDFDFSNTTRPDNIKNSENSGAPGKLTNAPTDTGISGIAPVVNVHNGNVPTLDRDYANFFQKDDCQQSFTVTPDANGYTFTGITLTDENGVVRTTYAQLYSLSNGVFTFQPKAMAELPEGTYTVTFDYYQDSNRNGAFDAGENSYENDPSFTLHVYGPEMAGYRYIRLWVKELDGGDGSQGNDGNAQFSEISFCKDEKGNDPYVFSEAARMYDYNINSNGGSFEGEDAWLCIDNNTRTKFCTQWNKDGQFIFVIDLGEGYQMSPNLYGYISYTTAGDTYSYNRSPVDFQYDGSNDPNAWKQGKKTDAGIWNQNLITVKKNEMPATNVHRESETFVGPFNNTYTLTYDANANGGTVTWWKNSGLGGNADGTPKNVVDRYGDVVVTFCVPEKLVTTDGSTLYFQGWSEDPKATRADYTPGSHFDLIYDATLYAVWGKNPQSWALVYVANLPTGVSIVDLSNMPRNQYGVTDEAAYGSIQVSTLSPLLKNYRFVEWLWYGNTDNHINTGFSEVGLEEIQHVQPGETIRFYENAALYAQWSKAFCITIPTGTGYSVSADAKYHNVDTHYFVDDANGDGKGDSDFTFAIYLTSAYNQKEPEVRWKRQGDIGWTKGSVNLVEKGKYSCTIGKTNITDDIEIRITPALNKYKITVNTDKNGYAVAGTNADLPALIGGTKTWNAADISHGLSYGFKVTPPTGFNIASVTANGKVCSPTAADGNSRTYYLIGIQQDMQVNVYSGTTRFNLALHYGEEMTSREYWYSSDAQAKYVVPDCPASFSNPGYSFAGWATSEGGTVKFYPGTNQTAAELGATAVDNMTVNLYAVWAVEMTVTFVDVDGATVLKTVKCKVGDDISGDAPASEAPVGHSAYWYLNGTKYDLSHVTGSVTVKRQYEPIHYFVKFEANGGSGTMAPQEFVYGKPGELAPCTFTRTDHEFDGWTGSDGKSYSDKQSVTDLTTEDGAEITMTAKWKANGYTLTLMNGSTQYLSVEGVLKLTNKPDGYAGGPSRTGWTLDGWYTSMGSTGEKKLNSDGTPVNGELKLNGPMTLYAKWKRTVWAPYTGSGLPGTEFLIVNTDGNRAIGVDETWRGNFITGYYTDYSVASRTVTSETLGTTACITGDIPDDAVWITNGKKIRNNAYSDRYITGNTLSITTSGSDFTWEKDNKQLYTGNTNKYYLYYDDGFKFSGKNNKKSISLYVQQEVYSFDAS